MTEMHHFTHVWQSQSQTHCSTTHQARHVCIPCTIASVQKLNTKQLPAAAVHSVAAVYDACAVGAVRTQAAAHAAPAVHADHAVAAVHAAPAVAAWSAGRCCLME